MSSLWIETTKDEIQTSSLIKDEKTEICVIGAGLFGLTTAYYLSKYGKKVIVIDKDKIGEKVSGNTTGKITSQHELFYNYLINDYGEEYAKKYLEANEKAIKNIKRIVDEEQIDCDFEIKPAYVFAQKEDEVLDIEKEVNAVNKLGKKAEYVNEIKYFPIQIKGAIKFENQAQFHPRKYMLGLCKSILTQNKIYENTTALEVERSGNNYIIHTDKGDIETEKIVIATHYPILNMPGFYFTKMYQSTSYVIAIEANQKIPYGMFISAKEPIYSFRTAKYQGKDILLICGSDHKTGEAIATNEKYKELEDFAKKQNIKIFKISSATNEGIENLLSYVAEELKKLPKEDLYEETDKVIYTLEEDKKDEFFITKEKNTFILTGKAIERLMGRININDNESMYYFHKCLENIGVNKALKDKGIKQGDIVKILDYELEWFE